MGTDGDLPDGFVTPFFMTANYMEMKFDGHQYFTVNAALTEQELTETM